MKKVIMALYVASVLLTSGLIKANAAIPTGQDPTQYQSPVTIFEVNQGNSPVELKVFGSIPSPCHSEPAAILLEDSQDPSVLVLHLSTVVPQNQCVTVIKNFNSDINLSTVAQTSKLLISESEMYLVRVSGSNFEVRVPGKDLQ